MDICYKFSKESFLDFFKLMQSFGQVHAPVRVSEQSFSFRPVEKPEQIAFEALRTILPPKKMFFPQRETLISYSGKEVKDHTPEPLAQVLFGVHPCDLAGLGIMDNIFSAGPPDSHYLARRQATLVVGLSCMPDKHCFCNSMGTDFPHSAYDIFLTDIGEDYYLQIATTLGEKLFDPKPDFIKTIDDQDNQSYKDFWTNRDKAFTSNFKSDNLKQIFDLEKDNPVWEELGKRCLSCGNCTPVCPTCYCFDVIDVASLDGNSGSREREWDSCQFTGFAKVSGDFNFRPGPVDRLKFWYRHKLHGFDDSYGLKTCVGCGRCTVSCPADIDDIVGVVLRLQASQNESKKDESA
jgi:sulfhydrogenase subunit beta (sulfur reductase)